MPPIGFEVIVPIRPHDLPRRVTCRRDRDNFQEIEILLQAAQAGDRLRIVVVWNSDDPVAIARITQTRNRHHCCPHGLLEFAQHRVEERDLRQIVEVEVLLFAHVDQIDRLPVDIDVDQERRRPHQLGHDERDRQHNN